jgi:hypothetical protein
MGALAGLALLLAAPARGARLVAVRVAQHPGFARVVFESDAPAAFDVEPPHGDEPVRVRLDASCTARSVTARGAPGLNVRLEPVPDGGCLALVRAPGPLRIEAQVLDHPPRVVLDFAPTHDTQPAPAATPVPQAAPEPSAAQPSEPSPSPPEQAPPAQPETPSVAAPAPAPEPTPVAPEPSPPALPPPPEVPAMPGPPTPTPPVVASPPPGKAVPIEREPAPSSAVDWDARSLAVGLALGAFVGMLGSAARRPERASKAERVAAPEEVAPAVARASPVAAPRHVPPAPAPADGEVLADLLAMLQGIDRRLASVESGCGAMHELCERLTAREAAHREELASQRVALARLDRALRRPPPRPSESAQSSPR